MQILWKGIFFSSHNLKLHISRLHGEGTKEKYFCNLCGKDFSEENYLKRHLKITHKNEGNHKCKSCEEIFSTKEEVAKHYQLVHDEKDRQCKTCDKILLTKSRLNHHMKIVHETKNFKCELCDKAFACKRHLTRHLGAKIHKRKETLEL